MKITVGITGASGAVYAFSLIRILSSLNIETSVIMTDMGKKVLDYECGVSPEEIAQFATIHDNDNLFSTLASGSVKSDGMVIIPCSMNTLGSIANGVGDNLLLRCASVTMKEGRKLVIVPRETPYNTISLENMLKLSKCGVCILPASPGFYTHPAEIWQLVNSICMRVLDQFDIKNDIGDRWNGGD